ncbi:MAG: hypothetical protein SNJ84_03690, partial [Verrucomicrobiia bacterium]
EIAALSLAGNLILDLQGIKGQAETPRYKIKIPAAPDATETTVLLLDDGGNRVDQTSDARYRFRVTVHGRSMGGLGVRQVHVRAEWPAVGAQNGLGSAVETIAVIP